MIYYTSEELFDFKILKTIRYLGENIYSGKITINEADQEQAHLVEYILYFNDKPRPKNKNDKNKKNKKDVLDTAKNLHDGRELLINAFKSELFPLKSTTRTGLKISTPKQLLQRFPVALAHGKAGNNSESLLNEIRQIIYFLYQSKEIAKKVYSNIIKSIQQKKLHSIIKMDTILMNSGNSKTSEPYVLILKLTDKLDLRRGENIIVLSNLSIYYTWKNIKSLYHNNLKYLLQHGMINLNYPMLHIRYQISISNTF